MKTQEPFIQLLPIELANQIAAGEVVERPSSVLKELLENSLDADATSISAMLEDGGQAYIRVSDNGKGIAKEELALAVTRHATSKIRHIGDLSSILSFGFRGEALPSIASVSRFRISSCPRSYPPNEEESQAYALDVHFGEHKELQPVTLQQGTQVEVRDLFNNIPARLKFLKTPSTELKRAQDIFTRIGLIHTDKAFTFHAGSREALSFLLQDSLYQRLCKIWTPNITEDMLEVDTTIYNDIHISGLISNPRSLYSKSDKLLLYVNSRPVSDKVLVRAIRQAYKNSLTTKDYPQLILNINIDPEEVDVNVHPAKSEVRFRDEQRVFKAVYTALDQTLSKKLFFNQYAQQENAQSQVPTFEQEARLAEQAHNEYFAEREKLNNFQASSTAYNVFDDVPPFHSTKNLGGNVSNEFAENIVNKDKFSSSVTGSYSSNSIKSSNNEKSNPVGFWGDADIIAMDVDKTILQKQEQAVIIDDSKEESKENSQYSNSVNQIPKFLCQVASSYLVFQTLGKEIFVLDQHAVHERILFEKLANKVEMAVQHLLIPVELYLHDAEVKAYEKLRAKFANLGFISSIEEEKKLVVTAIPVNFQHATTEQFIRNSLKNEEADILKMFMDAACDAALKAHQNLTYAEAIDLYKQWSACDEPDFCPHGRPCYNILDERYFNRLFKRT